MIDVLELAPSNAYYFTSNDLDDIHENRRSSFR